jgi:LysR family hydrogen peroxide-inducible transcriptional activator
MTKEAVVQSKLNFSLTQLEYVLAVQKHGHFAKAAKSCFVTQPTLSMQIQKLEDVLGTIIFDRSKKPILMTEKGKKLVEQMQSVVHEARKLEAIIQENPSGKIQGELTVGIIPTIAPYLLPKLLPAIESMFPDLQLRIFEMQTHKIIDALNDDEIDVGLLATPLKVPKIHERALYWEPFSVLCKKGHVLSKQKRVKYSSLDSNDIWLLEEGHCLRHQILDVCSIKQKKSAKRKYNFESGSLETLKNIVNSYGGYTLLPFLATESLGPNAVLIPFERPIPAREIGLVTRRDHYKGDLLDALEGAILKCIPESLRKIRQKDLDVLPVE